MKRAAGAVSIVAISAAVAVACSQQDKDAAKESVSSATSAASSAISAGGSAASSAASSASSAVSSVVAGAPSTVTVPGGGEVVLEPAIAEAYTKAGGEAKLGAPSGQPEKVGDGTVQAFAKGTIFSSPSTGAHLVRAKS